jgi:transcriptional regulator with XRE-family HTH domain
MQKTDIKYFILALKIKELRRKLKMSLKDLGKASSISVSYLNEIEKAKKYPKEDKLKLLAQALFVTPKYLTSSDKGAALRPVFQIFNKNIMERLPLNEFGINEFDLFEIISSSTEKCSYLIVILNQLVNHFSITFDNVNYLALNALQQIHLNHFSEIEKLSQIYRKIMNWGSHKGPNFNDLITLLEQKYNYTLELKSNYFEGELKDLLYLLKTNNQNRLIINSKLSQKDKTFLVAKILYYCIQKKIPPKFEMPKVNTQNHHDFFTRFKSNYFAGALIIDYEFIVSDLKIFFGDQKFDIKRLHTMMERYYCTPKVFFHRIAQIIPHHFGITQLFVLETDHHLKSGSFKTSNALNLSQTFINFTGKIGEHECRRKINITLLKNLQQVSSKFIIGAQIVSIKENKVNKESYFILSIAFKDIFKPDLNLCITIGIEINSKTKSIISFLRDKDIIHKNIGSTCERCEILECEQRVSEAIVFKDQQQKLNQEALIADLLKK